MNLDEERVYGNKYKFNYVFERADQSPWLIVTFSSGVSKTAEIKRPYHYINLCREFPCNRLYIQDSIGARGTYYLCHNMDFEVTETVCNLILAICKEYNISVKNIIVLGSCKGASAAIHIGLKLNAGNILAIHPQLKIGSYTKKYAFDVYEDLVGNDNEKNLEIIDEYIINLLKQNRISKLRMLVSELDKDYTIQILPFEKSLLTDTNDKVLIEKNDLILSHDDTFFNYEFFKKHICKIIFNFDYFYKNGIFYVKNDGDPVCLLIQRFKNDQAKRIICNKALEFDLKDIKSISVINQKDNHAGIQIYSIYNTFIPKCEEKNDILICENNFEQADDIKNCYLKIYCNNQYPIVVKSNGSYNFYIYKKEFSHIHTIKFCWEIDDKKYEKVVYKAKKCDS